MQHAQIITILNSTKNCGIMALDIGSAKVGIAYADYSIGIALPIEVIFFKSNVSLLLQKIDSLIAEKNIVLLVIGVNKISPNATHSKLIKEIEKHCSIPITYEDEAFTTSIANNLMKQHNIKRKKRHQVDDMIAAQLILESFLQKIK